METLAQDLSRYPGGQGRSGGPPESFSGGPVGWAQMNAVRGKTTTSVLWVQAIAGSSTPHMLDHYAAAMEAEEGPIRKYNGSKVLGS